MPFKRPHQRTRPDIDRKPAAKNRARHRGAAIMHKRGDLTGIDRLVGNKHIWQLQLQGRHTWIAPFMLGCDMQLFPQLVGANSRQIAIQITHRRTTILVADKLEVQIKRTAHHEIAALHPDHRRTA